jgi:arsenite oxidase small subunit
VEKSSATNTRYLAKDELKKFDGKEGRPLYLAFKNKIYDVSASRLWVNGQHMQIHQFNEDIETTIKAAPHSEEVLTRFPIIGELKQEEAVKQTNQADLTPPVKVEQAQAPKQVLERRNFLKLVVVAGGALALISMTSILRSLVYTPQSTKQLSWPKLKIANINSIQLLTPITFNYPLTNTPNFLVKLGVQADNGVGPENDVVAFSGICQHLGCYYGFVSPGSSPPCNSAYKAATPEGYCCCHGSQYDFVHGAKVIGGPAPRALPQVQLEFDQSTGDIYAVAMNSPTIFGHGPAGTTDPALVLQYDLQGGDVVTT